MWLCVNEEQQCVQLWKLDTERRIFLIHKLCQLSAAHVSRLGHETFGLFHTVIGKSSMGPIRDHVLLETSKCIRVFSLQNSADEATIRLVTMPQVPFSSVLCQGILMVAEATKDWRRDIFNVAIHIHDLRSATDTYDLNLHLSPTLAKVESSSILVNIDETTVFECLFALVTITLKDKVTNGTETEYVWEHCNIVIDMVAKKVHSLGWNRDNKVGQALFGKYSCHPSSVIQFQVKQL